MDRGVIHIDYAPDKNCKHPEWTYGEICVKCNECGRFGNKTKCINCGKKVEINFNDYPKGWGKIEFYDAYEPVCPKCSKLFHTDCPINKEFGILEGIGCMKKDFKRRKNGLPKDRHHEDA